MHLKKYIGCLLATGLATTSAFAAEWFANQVQETLGTGWTVPAGSWTWSGTYGKLNSPDKELKFVATTAKALPGDESTISTSVKFTAMDKADFLVDGNLPEIPTDAKGGLTIIEDSDVNPATTKFYGIVGGAWVELEGDTAAALAGQVNVEVKIWENNGKHISYKVGAQSLTLKGESDLAASFTDETISSVSYQGVCEIASLQGAAQDELWMLTLKTIADVQSVLYKVGSGEWTTVPAGNKIKATTEDVQVKYVAKEGKYFFPVSTGAGVTELTGTATTVSGDADLSDDAALANVSTAIEAVAEVVEGGSGKFASIAAAVGAGTKVNVLKDASETVTIGKALTLTTTDNTVDVGGTIKLVENGVLTIEGGAYACTFDEAFTPETLILKGGLFKDTKDDIQPFCAVKYFATAMVGDYQAKVEKGTEVAASGDVPEMAVDSSVVTAAGGAANVATYLAGKAENGLEKWQNYALGLGTETSVKPGIVAVNDGTVDGVVLAPSFEALKSTGVSVTYSVDDGMPSATVPVLPLPSGVAKKTVKVFTGATLAASTTIGVNKVATTTTRTLVTMPWAADEADVALPLNNVFKKTSLAVNDKVEIYDAEADIYETWRWNGTAWVDATEVDGTPREGAAEPNLTRGQALWFSGAQAGNVYQMGVALESKDAQPTVKAGKWAFVALPVDQSATTVAEIAGTAGELKIQIEKAGKATVFYKDATEGWGYDDYYKKSGQKWAKKQFKAAESAEMIVAPNVPCWILNGGTSDAKVSL